MTGRRYESRYVHKISSSDRHVGPDVELSEADLSGRKELGAALRKARILNPGEAIEHFRREGERIVAFPRASIWHAIVLEPEEPTPSGLPVGVVPAVCEICGGDPAKREGVNCWSCGEPSEMG